MLHMAHNMPIRLNDVRCNHLPMALAEKQQLVDYMHKAWQCRHQAAFFMGGVQSYARAEGMLSIMNIECTRATAHEM